MDEQLFRPADLGRARSRASSTFRACVKSFPDRELLDLFSPTSLASASLPPHSSLDSFQSFETIATASHQPRNALPSYSALPKPSLQHSELLVFTLHPRFSRSRCRSKRRTRCVLSFSLLLSSASTDPPCGRSRSIGRLRGSTSCSRRRKRRTFSLMYVSFRSFFLAVWLLTCSPPAVRELCREPLVHRLQNGAKFLQPLYNLV